MFFGNNGCGCGCEWIIWVIIIILLLNCACGGNNFGGCGTNTCGC